MTNGDIPKWLKGPHSKCGRSGNRRESSNLSISVKQPEFPGSPGVPVFCFIIVLQERRNIMRKKFLTALVSASVAALALSGCGGKTSESTAAADQNSAAAESSSESAGGEGAKKVLRFGQANAGDGLDMQTSTSSRAASIADEVTESLLRFDDDNNEEPVLITDFPTVSDDGLTYSFELKQGVHFTNGTELTSKDVKFTFERMFTPATAARRRRTPASRAGGRSAKSGS